MEKAILGSCQVFNVDNRYSNGLGKRIGSSLEYFQAINDLVAVLVGAVLPIKCRPVADRFPANRGVQVKAGRGMISWRGNPGCGSKSIFTISSQDAIGSVNKIIFVIFGDNNHLIVCIGGKSLVGKGSDRPISIPGRVDSYVNKRDGDNSNSPHRFAKGDNKIIVRHDIGRLIGWGKREDLRRRMVIGGDSKMLRVIAGAGKVIITVISCDTDRIFPWSQRRLD